MNVKYMLARFLSCLAFFAVIAVPIDGVWSQDTKSNQSDDRASVLPERDVDIDRLKRQNASLELQLEQLRQTIDNRQKEISESVAKKSSGEGEAALLGALIGAVAGLAGGAFAAFAALRASQVAARAPLTKILTRISNTLILLQAITGDEQRFEVEYQLERQWSELAIHQRILCPSKRMENLLALLLAIGRNRRDHPEDLLKLAGQTLEKVTYLIAAHSGHVFRWRAKLEESKIIRNWLMSDKSRVLNEATREKLARLIMWWMRPSKKRILSAER
jgi:uncharacterized membrane protein